MRFNPEYQKKLDELEEATKKHGQTLSAVEQAFSTTLLKVPKKKSKQKKELFPPSTKPWE